MDKATALLTTLVAYKVVLIGIGFFAQRRTRDGADYFLGGRRLGPTVAAVSAAASSSSAWTLLGVSGQAYVWGMGALWFFPACVGGFILNWRFIAPRLNRLSHASAREGGGGYVTLTDVLAGPPGRRLRREISTVAALIILVSMGAYVASQFQAAGKTFHSYFDMSAESAILIGAGIVIFYTLLGGFWAVSITDTLQGMLMAVSAVVLPVAALIEVGGVGALADGIAWAGVDGYASLTRNMAGPAAIGFIVGTLGIGIGYPGQPHVVNRFMALKDDPESMRRARIIAVTWAVAVYSGMILLGLSARVLLEGGADKEKVLFLAADTLFPPVVTGVMVAAVLSAVMSTADSQLLVAASAVTNDLGLGGGRASMLARSRVVVVLLSLGALASALWGSEDIFTKVLFAWSAMGCAFGPVLVWTLFKGEVPPGRTLASILVGFAVSVSAYTLRKGAAPDAWVPFLVDWGVALERLGGFAVALVIVAWPGRK